MQGKHIPGRGNFIPGRSPLTHTEPQKLIDQFAGKGDPVGAVPRGQPGFKERVDFGEIIGEVNGQPTTKRIIHYGKDGVHIVPANPSEITIMTLEKERALLAIQQGLLGEVSALLRAVTVRVSADHLHFDSYYDGHIDEDDAESMSCVETELIAILAESIRVTHALHRLDVPSDLPKTDIFVYLRRE